MVTSETSAFIGMGIQEALCKHDFDGELDSIEGLIRFVELANTFADTLTRAANQLEEYTYRDGIYFPLVWRMFGFGYTVAYASNRTADPAVIACDLFEEVGYPRETVEEAFRVVLSQAITH